MGNTLLVIHFWENTRICAMHECRSAQVVQKYCRSSTDYCRSIVEVVQNLCRSSTEVVQYSAEAVQKQCRSSGKQCRSSAEVMQKLYRSSAEVVQKLCRRSAEVVRKQCDDQRLAIRKCDLITHQLTNLLTWVGARVTCVSLECMKMQLQ